MGEPTSAGDNGPQRAGCGPWLAGIVVGLIVVIPAIALFTENHRGGGTRAEGKATTGATAPAPAPSGPGKALFTAKCGSCHTLSAAGTSGTVGPSLDALKPEAALVLAALHNGGTGSGTMPRDLSAGAQAKQVAEYVAQVAGR